MIRVVVPGMLLLTDRPGQSRYIQQAINTNESCTVVALNDALAQPARHAMIACDVELGDEGSAKLLRTALLHHRTDPDLPVLILTRDHSHLTIAQAKALGATELLPCNAPLPAFRSTIERLGATYSARSVNRHSADRDAAGRALEAKSTLVDLFGQAQRQTPISSAALHRGATMVMAAIKRDTIRTWLDVVWKYDDVTYQHCLLVAGLSAAFGMKLGLAPQSQRLLSQAALIHDVGKARVPHQILNKSGRLTAEDVRILRTHPVVGYDMLARQAGLDRTILDVVRHHHEYLDGSGYPDRLKGNQISGFVRIVTICDIYAALIERRPYKGPMPTEQAYAVLVEMGGKLDGGLVSAFHSIVRES